MITYDMVPYQCRSREHVCRLASWLINSRIDNLLLTESEKFREVLSGLFEEQRLDEVYGARDGFVVQITEPVASDLYKKPSKIYMNRNKGY